MPQMSPMNWTIMLFSFIMLYLLIMTLNYFQLPSQKMTSNQSNWKKNFNSINWKW
uniref:ATP synthase complex subunit 8 n=1 Tax=Cacoplistes rogenhoferi TaxID=2316737 RepID=A0A385I1W6_9ORTH|nr:ATP synthase F0 subunit 8 [Cacoplistes rogenhoferi]AXY63901.1 ATP synthase F0 subunit 8 [Cacoplistes rogenhoferi]